MTTLLALPLLFEAVVAAFVATPSVTVSFGWKRPNILEPSPRIVFVPGDEDDAGEIVAPREVGRNPRSLAQLDELFTVYVVALDESDPWDELKQYTACRNLFDACIKAIYRSAHGTYVAREVAWVDPGTTLRVGAALRVVFEIQAPIPDTTMSEMTAEEGARGLGGTEVLDLEETDETAPPPPAARAASTANLVLDGPQTIDGVAVVAGNRVLAKNQTAPAENGLYDVALGAWSRTADTLEHGTHVFVELGTTNGAAGFELTTADPIVVGTTPLTFERVSP